MPEFRSYDSIEEMFEDQARNEQAANDAVLPKQREITWGSYWLRPTDDGVLIFGRVHTQEEIFEDDKKIPHQPGDPSPKAVVRHYTEMHERGYRFGTAYSVWCPEGELGSSHVSVLWPIHQEEFEAAREAEWNPGAIPWFHEMLIRVTREYQKEASDARG
jgi:hypothetical protein